MKLATLRTLTTCLQFAVSHVTLSSLSMEFQHPWQWPTQPWAHIHLDFTGPYLGHTLSDASSNWLETHIMSSEKTIEILRSVIATSGLPQIIVADNGPPFTSNELRDFTHKKWIKQHHTIQAMVKLNRQFELSNKDLKEHREIPSKKDYPSFSLSIA